MVEVAIKMFVGIRVPGDVADSLRTFCDAHFADLNEIQWVSKSNLHITLRFLGLQTKRSANLIAEGLAAISSTPVSLTLNGGGFFEDAGVLFVRVLPAPELMKLQTSVDQVALGNGVLPAQHPYNPHISIARINEALIERGLPRTNFHQAALQLDEFYRQSPIHYFQSSEISLFSSIGGRYDALRSFRLENHLASE